MKPNMSKTAALAMARKAVGDVHRRSSTSYTVYGPYRANKPDGPSTEMQKSSFPAAAAMRAHWVAEVALYAMYPDCDAEVLWTALDDAEHRGGAAEVRLAFAADRVANFLRCGSWSAVRAVREQECAAKFAGFARTDTDELTRIGYQNLAADCAREARRLMNIR